MCRHGYQQAYNVIRQMERTIFLPNLENPPAGFWQIATPYITGRNTEAGFPVFSCEVTFAIFYDMMGEPVPKMSWADTTRFYGLKLLMWFVGRYPAIADALANIFFISKTLRHQKTQMG